MSMFTALIGAGCRRLATVVATAMLAVGLTGCLDIEADFKATQDGGGSVVGRLALERELEDVFIAVQAFARLHNEAKIAVMGRGICAAAGAIAEQEGAPVRFVSRQYMAGDRLICDFSTTVPKIDPATSNPDGLGIFSLERPAANQWRVTLDLDKVPDLVPFLSISLNDALRKNPQIAPDVSGRDLIELTEKVQRATSTLVAMAFRDHHLQLSFTGTRIVDAEGATSNDGRTATFRIPIREVLKLATDQQARLGRKLSVTLEY